MKRISHLSLLIIMLSSALSKACCSPSNKIIDIPIPLSYYEKIESEGKLSLKDILISRINTSPFNATASAIFLLAILHTFVTPSIKKLANKIQQKNINQSPVITFFSEILHFCSEVEIVFGLWCIPLVVCLICTFGWDATTSFFKHSVNYSEPIFVFAIMTMTATKPVLILIENILSKVAKIGKYTPASWWLSILILSSMMGSLITEPAAMTLGAMLLSKKFYQHDPSNKLKYATLGLLFVNVSVGGTLTHFAAPPILMVADKWGLTFSKVFTQLGCHAIAGILLNTFLYYAIFHKEFSKLRNQRVSETDEIQEKIPFVVTIVHILFLCWTVINLHTPALVISGLLFFIGFIKATSQYQSQLEIRNPLLVGFFLAGLVTHGGFQSWWLSPVLSSLTETTLFLGATILTAFNDNAAITYLSSLVPAFSANNAMQKAVLSGAVTGGGLTVIANAPNPAGQSILSKHFPSGISPIKLFLSAVVPTIIMGICFMI